MIITTALPFARVRKSSGRANSGHYNFLSAALDMHIRLMLQKTNEGFSVVCTENSADLGCAQRGRVDANPHFTVAIELFNRGAQRIMVEDNLPLQPGNSLA